MLWQIWFFFFFIRFTRQKNKEIQGSVKASFENIHKLHHNLLVWTKNQSGRMSYLC